MTTSKGGDRDFGPMTTSRCALTTMLLRCAQGLSLTEKGDRFPTQVAVHQAPNEDAGRVRIPFDLAATFEAADNILANVEWVPGTPGL